MRRAVIGLLLVFAAATPASAQSFGVKGGLTLANVNITDPRALPVELQWCCSPWDGTRRDAAVGVFAGVQLDEGLELTVEALFTQRGFRIGRNGPSDGASLRMSYVEVPILARLMGDWINLFAGPMVAVKTSASQSSANIAGGGTYLDRAALATGDLGLVVGAGLHRGRWSLDGRYVHGLRNVIRNAPEGATLKHKSLMLLAGVRLAGCGCAPLPKPPQPKRY